MIMRELDLYYNSKYILYRNEIINNAIFPYLLNFISQMLQPVRICKYNDEIYYFRDCWLQTDEFDCSRVYIAALYANINDQVQKQGFYSYDFNFNWCSYCKNMKKQ